MDVCMHRVGEGTEQGGGFYTVEDGEEKEAAKVLRLNMGSRGRHIDHVDNFPPQFSQLCLQVHTHQNGFSGSLVCVWTSGVCIARAFHFSLSFRMQEMARQPSGILATKSKVPSLLSKCVYLLVHGLECHSSESRGRSAPASESGARSPSALPHISCCRLSPKSVSRCVSASSVSPLKRAEGGGVVGASVQSLEAGRKADTALTDMSPNTVLINFYKVRAKPTVR